MYGMNYKGVFVVTEILTDWTHGMAVVIAGDESDVVGILRDKFGDHADVDGNIRWVADAPADADIGVVEYVWGGS